MNSFKNPVTQIRGFPQPLHEGADLVDFSGFVTLISCHDFRRDDLGINKQRLYRYVEKLKKLVEKKEWYARHLSFRHPVGVGAVVARFRDKEFAKKVVSLPNNLLRNEHLEEMGIPLAWYVNTIIAGSGGNVVVTWYLPSSINPGEIYWKYEGRGKVFRAYKIPVYTCKPSPGEEDIPVLGRTVKELLSFTHKPPLRLRTPLIAYVIMAMLDRFRLITINEMVKIPSALEARGLEDVLTTGEDFRKKYILKYYNLLSENMVIGRYRVYRKDFIWRSVTMLLETTPENLDEFYGFLAVTGSAAHVYVGEDVVLAMPRLDYSAVLRYRGLLQELGDARLVTRILSYPFPYELYDPLSDAWRKHPVKRVTELFKKLRLTRRQG